VPAKGNFICIAEGFPATPFFVDRNLERPDGIIQCREISTAELAGKSWSVLRALSQLLRGIPIEF